MNPTMSNLLLRSLGACLLVCISLAAEAQIISRRTGNWSATTTWNGGVVPGPTDDVVIADNHTVTLETDATVRSLQIGQGNTSTGRLTMGNDATARSLTVGNLTLFNNGRMNIANPGSAVVHTLNISGDYVNLGGAMNLSNSDAVANTTWNNTSTAVFSGTTSNTFHNLTIDGGGNLIVASGFVVNGDFTIGSVTNANIAVTANNENLNFRGAFTLNNGASFSAANSTTDFDGATDQILDLASGSAEFNNVVFDNSTKTINGNFITNGGTVTINDDAAVADQSAGNTHLFHNLRTDNQNGLNFSGSTVQFDGGTLRFGSNRNSDGTIDFGVGAGEATDASNDVNIVFIAGTTTLERDDQLVVDGNVTISAPAQFVIDGTSSQSATELDATMTDHDGTHTLTIESSGDIYLRGEDNFPASFQTYTLGINSFVRYDRSYNQTIRGENNAGTEITFGRVVLNGSGFFKTLASGHNLTLTNEFSINGPIFSVSHEADLTFGGSIQTSDAAAGFNATASTVYLVGTENQTMDVFEGFSDYFLRQLIITNPDNEARTVNIDDNIFFSPSGTSPTTQSLFQASNAGGSASNILTIDIDGNQLIGSNFPAFKDEFNLGANVRLQSSGELFATDFDDVQDVASFDISSVVRLDGNTSQEIPAFTNPYGNLEFNGDGNKYLASNVLTVAGDVSRVGGRLIFNLDQTLISSSPNPLINVVITVGGGWNVGTAHTAVNGNNSTVVFNGASPAVSASNFENLTFSNTGTAEITGDLFVTGNINLTSGAILTTTRSINISGDWMEAATAQFTATGGTTTFLGGTTQNIVTQPNSYFYDLDVENGSTLSLENTAGTYIRADRDVDVLSGCTLDLDGAANTNPQILRLGRRLLMDGGSSLNFDAANAIACAIIMDGDVSQDFDNEIGGPYPTLQFEGVGEKDLTDFDFDIDGNFIIASEATVNGNSEEIDFAGSLWTNNGIFTHNRTVAFTGTTVTVSASNFNSVSIGDGTTATDVTLTGNLSLSGNMTIQDQSSLDVNGSNYNVTLEGDWNNYGTFTARQGTVTFISGGSEIRTQFSTDVTLEPQATAKAFYNLRVNKQVGSDLVFEDDEIQDGIITVLNDLVVESGNLRFNEDTNLDGNNGGPADQTTSTLRVGGDFIFEDGVLEYAANDINTIELNGTSGGTHSIDLGGNIVREFQITGSDTYQLISAFEIRDDNDDEFVLSGTGTLDLNGQIMQINRGGILMSNGVLQVDAGASLVINDLAANPDFEKTGGEIELLGTSETPATLTAVDAGGFTFTQTGGDFEANFYNIANTNGDGINIEGGTITNFSEGIFTNGIGGSNAYLTLRNIDIGTINATGVAFNAGPNHNVSVDPGSGNEPTGGTINFIIAGGTLSGASNEEDSPDGGDVTGFIRWQNPDGFTWTGGSSTDWNTSGNWTVTGAADGNGNGYPDENDDDVFIVTSANLPTIDETVNIGRVDVISGTVSINNGKFDVDGNVTIFNGATISLANATDSLKVAGSFANAGTFAQNTGQVVFDGLTGSYSINSDDDFVNLIIDGGADVVYGLGSAITVTDGFLLTGGTFDASSGFALRIEGDWTVSGGIFNPGVGTVQFNGTTGNQNLAGGTLNNATFTGAATKTFTSNMAFGGDVNINSGTGNVISDNGSAVTIFVGDDWNLNQSAGFLPNDGTVVFNGQGGQNIGGGFDLEFNNITFQGSNVKNLNRNTTINGDFTIIAAEVDMNLGVDVTSDGTGNFGMTGGVLDIEGSSNFPTNFANYNLNGGTVRYVYNDNDQIIAGGIAYNRLEMFSNNNNDVITRTLGGDITVRSQLVVSRGDVTLDVAGYTITFTAENIGNGNHFAIESDDIVTWGASGRVVHSGDSEWDIDADFVDQPFNDMILTGGRKEVLSDLVIRGDLSIGNGVNFDQNANNVLNDDGVADGDAFTLGANAYYENNNSGNSLASGWDSYSISPSSRVRLDASGNQTLFTNGGTITYGELQIYSDQNVTLDGNLVVEGNFDMNNQPTLLDNDGGGPYNITFNGTEIDIQNYVPTNTITFNGGDQNIRDNSNDLDNLRLNNVVFAGTGTKRFYPNDANNETTDIDGTVVINAGITLETDRRINFSGSTFTNNGTLNVTNTGRPFIFDGTDQSFNPGTNSLGALTLSNAGTVTITDNALDIGNGDITLDDGATLDFGTFNHTIASDDWILNNVGGNGGLVFGAVGTETTLTFDRIGTQRLPFIHATASTAVSITNIPNIVLSGTGTKLLTNNVLFNDLTIESTVNNFSVDRDNDYTIEIRGNWTNQGANFDEEDGLVLFYATNTDPKTITTNNENFAEVQFDGTADRTYTLMGNLTVEGENNLDRDADMEEDGLTITRGTLDVNGNNLNLGNNDTDDPFPEINVIGVNGRLIIDEGATLAFNTDDDNGNLLQVGGFLTVYGRIDIDGEPGNLATVTRNSGNDRIDIDIEAGATIEADNYSFNYLSDEGLEVKDGAFLATENGTASTFSNGSWNQIATDNGPNYYLSIEADLGSAITIDNVTFNFNGTPRVNRAFNVIRSADGGNNAITFTNTAGPLGTAGETYDSDPGDLITWPTPTTTTWLGTTSADWTEATNWDAGVPTETLEAVIPLGSPFNPTYDLDGVGTDTLGALTITDGILRMRDSNLGNGIDTVMVAGNFQLGNGSNGTMITETGMRFGVIGSFTISNNANFDDGDITILLAGPSSTTPTFRTGNETVPNVNVIGDADYTFVGTNMTITGDFTVSGNASINPGSGGYDLFVGGDITGTGSTFFNTATDGTVFLNGADQTVTNFDFDELTAAGTGTKTLDGVTIADVFVVNSGVTVLGAGNISWANNVTINGNFQGAADAIYTFTGENWISAPSAYTNALGTVIFARNSGTQYIRQTTNGNNPVTFHNLTFREPSNKRLGRFINGAQEDGNVNMTGDLVVESTNADVYLESYLIDNTNGVGTQTMTVQATEIVRVTGANNFPANFDTYSLDATSRVLYNGQVDQTIYGGIAYGRVDLTNDNVKTLAGDVEFNGDLYITNSTLDVSTNNYSIRAAGRWDTDNGINDGTFLARNGTVIFDGSIDQSLALGEGTQSFNRVEIDKSGGSKLNLEINDLIIAEDLTIPNGQLDINSLNTTIGGSLDITGTGDLISDGAGDLIFTGTSGTPNIRTNGSFFNGNVEINNATKTFTMLDDFTVDNVLTITAGTLDLNGNTLEAGNTEDVINIFGTLNVSTTSAPGGTLALGNATQLVVQPSGRINVVGTASQTATVTHRSNTTGRYGFRVTGVIAAQHYLFEYMNVSGIYVTETGTINPTDNFSNGTFTNGASGTTYLRIENTQDLLESNGQQIANVVFGNNPGGGATNVTKSNGTSGILEFKDYTGEFSGEVFDNDPNDLISWLAPTQITWSGAVSTDWFNGDNWSSGIVPTSASNVVIPSSPTQAVLNPPLISDNALVAEVANLTIEPGNSLTLNTTDVDTDLRVSGTLTLETTSGFVSRGTADSIEVAGSMVFVGTPNFDAGSASTIRFTSPTGLVTVNPTAPFHNMVVDVQGSLNLQANTTVNGEFTLTAASGPMNLNGNDLLLKQGFTNLSASSGAIVTGTNSIEFDPAAALSYSITPGAVTYYDIQLGDAATAATYQLQGDLALSNTLNLTANTTLDLVGNSVSVGDASSDLEIFTLSGNMVVEGGEALRLGNGTELQVLSGGTFRLAGAMGNRATLTRFGNTGNYEVTVASGGTFGASFYDVRFTGGDGITLESGAILARTTGVTDIDPVLADGNDDVALDHGSFRDGAGTAYLTLQNSFTTSDGDALKGDVIAFNAGPTYNVVRLGSLDDIVLVDPEGNMQGANFENDDQNTPGFESTSGNIQWFYNNPLYTWTGANGDNDFFNDANWSAISPTGSGPNSSNTVIIPNIFPASNYPQVTADVTVANLTIDMGAQLTVDETRTLTLNLDLNNTGGLNLNGILEVNRRIVNGGLIIPGPNSTVRVNFSEDIEFQGGSTFQNLVFIADAPGRALTTTGPIAVNGNFTITNGRFSIGEASHTITVGGDFTVDETNGGAFEDNLGTVILNGTGAQTISNSAGSDLQFNSLQLSGGSAKIFSQNATINGDVTVDDAGTSLQLGSTTLTLNGDITFTNGSLNAGTSTVQFTGNSNQRIIASGSTTEVTFNNLTVNNTASGDSDVQLSVDVEVGGTANFVNGVVSSSASNPIVFLDGATVSYNGAGDSGAPGGGGITPNGASYVSGPVIKVGDDPFNFPTGDGSVFARIGISNIGSALATDTYTAQYSVGRSPDWAFTGEVSEVNPRPSGTEYWDVERVGTGQPQVTLYWEDESFSSISDIAHLTVMHFTGGVWVDEGGTAAGELEGGYITSANQFTSFSPETLGTTNEATGLPVELAAFAGESSEYGVSLTWETASETNNAYFEILHSTDGVNFEAIGTVDGYGTTLVAQEYAFDHTQAWKGINYYQLKQVDYNGTEEIVGTLSVNHAFGQGLFVSMYPNPVRNQLVLDGPDLEAGTRVVLYNLRGELVKGITLDAGGRQALDLTDVESGLYQLMLIAPNGIMTRQIAKE
ncbi:MAG TPA: hypothetical protein DCP28_03245 [Cytophagales bacterium]|nr:hypothetical protein [Cytophagales bacterium]